MGKTLLFSVVFHLLVLILIVIDLPFSFQTAIPEPVAIGVEMVTHLPEIKPKDIAEPDPVQDEPELIKPAERMAPPPPDSSETGAVEDIVEPVPEKIPDTPKPLEALPEKVPDLSPTPKPKPKLRPKPKPEAPVKAAAIRPAHKPKPVKASNYADFDDMADEILDDGKTKASGKGGGKKAPKGLEDNDRERISKQVQPCWVMQEVADVNVEISVNMGADGRFTNAKIKNSLFSGSAINRSIAEAAQRAILDQRCNDFSWLHEKFPDLDSLTLIFNPKDMVGW